MKILFTLIGVLLVVCSFGQPSSSTLNLDFTNASDADRFTPIGAVDGEFQKTVADGVMKVAINKSEWHFLQLYINPFDFLSHPYFTLRIKVDQPTPIRIWLKQADGAELTIVDKQLAQSDDFETISFKVDNPAPLSADLSEIGIDLGGFVTSGTFQGTVHIDEFKLGEAAQPTSSLSLDFSTPADLDRLNFITDDGGEFVKSLDNGAAKLVVNKREWHFIQVWVDPLEFIPAPFLSFRMKADQPTPLRIWVNQQGGTVEKELFNQTIPAGTEFVTYQVKIDDPTPLTGYLQELSIDIGGYQVNPARFAGTVYLDDLKLGEAARPATEVYGIGYKEDFSSPLYAGWTNGDGYSLTGTDGKLQLNVARSVSIPDAQISKLPSLSFQGKVIDLSAHPFANLSVKAADPFVLSVIPVDNLNQKKEFKIRVVPSAGYQTVSFDLSSLPGVDLSKIEKIYFDVNRLGFAVNATVFIDELSLGDQAANLPTMDAVADKSYYKNDGTKSILLTNVKYAASLSATTTGRVTSEVTTEPVTDGQSKLNFNIRPDTSGTDTVTILLKGGEGYADNTYTFLLKVEDNLPPTIDSITNIEAKVNKLVTIDLKGLSDGNAMKEQGLDFTVSSSNPKIVFGKVLYKGEGPFATLYLYPLKKGKAEVKLTVKDRGKGQNTRTRIFSVNVYQSLNAAPTIDSLPNQEVYLEAGSTNIQLTGISDGDNSKQKLTITAENSNPSVVSNLAVNYVSGNKAVLSYSPLALGASTITIKVKDNGGNGSNEGNDSAGFSFNITVLNRPVTGYIATLEKSVEGYEGNEKYNITEVDSAGFKALVFKATDKFYWDGVIMNLPEELDLSQHPYLTMEIYPIGQNTLHWMWFYDNSGSRNEQNNLAKAQWAEAGKWNKLVFNFGGDGDWNNGITNAPINTKRIRQVLFDMHNASFVFPPPPNYTGTFIIRNIRIGSAVDIQITPEVTISQTARQTVFTNSKSLIAKIAGLSDGSGDSSDLVLSYTSSNPSLLTNAKISPVNAKGEASFSYNTTGVAGKTTIMVNASASGATAREMSFEIEVVKEDAAAAALVTINAGKKFQTMKGFGTFTFSPTNIDYFTNELGASAVRIGAIGNQFEPVNDNDDPNVLNMDGFNYAAYDWNLYRQLKDRGVKTFILTSWSPPAWMKTNLSLDYAAPGYTLNTDGTENRLDYTMYDEFAESMVATVKAFEQQAGIHLEGIGLQNEPAFHEPYPSAILGPNEYVELIKVVGRRFKKEGISTRLYMPEHVSSFVDDISQYFAAVKADPEADKYCSIFAIHGYGSDGITPGQPKFEEWERYRDSSRTGPNPKEVWMSETHIEYSSFDNALSLAGAIYGALEYGNASLWTQWAFEGPFVSQGKPTGMLYSMANFARFIKPGDSRIQTVSENNDVLATSFINPKKTTLTMVLINKGDLPVTIKIAGQNLANDWVMYNTAENRNLAEVKNAKNGIFLLPPKSVSTIVNKSFGKKTNNTVDNLTLETSGEDSSTTNWKVYPNPARALFYAEGGSHRGAVLELVDVSGSVKLKTNLSPGTNAISTAHLRQGVYMVKIYDGDQVSVRKIIIRD